MFTKKTLLFKGNGKLKITQPILSFYHNRRLEIIVAREQKKSEIALLIMCLGQVKFHDNEVVSCIINNLWDKN